MSGADAAQAQITLEEQCKKGKELAIEEVHTIDVNTHQECKIEYLRKIANLVLVIVCVLTTVDSRLFAISSGAKSERRHIRCSALDVNF